MTPSALKTLRLGSGLTQGGLAVLLGVNVRSVKRRLCETVNGEKVFRRPHWRRGHLRHLGDGRIVPVSACIVNFNGEPVDPKLYVVKA